MKRLDAKSLTTIISLWYEYMRCDGAMPNDSGLKVKSTDHLQVAAIINQLLTAFSDVIDNITLSLICLDVDVLTRELSMLKDLLTWYKASNGKFYKVFKEWVNYTTAIERCVEEGAQLVTDGVRNTETRR